jgi:hypothetical protein
MSTQTPIEVFAEAIERGLKLTLQPPFSLVVEPAARCPDDFADTLSQHKPRLLALLKLPFVVVRSQALGETVFFCEDEQTKGVLIESGASEWSIYTRAELKSLIEQNRIAPFTANELCKLHEIKKMFKARIT